MTTPNIDIFKEYFPEFANAGDPLIERTINYALTYIDKGVWGVRYQYAWLYLTAHHLYLSLEMTKGQVKPILGGLTGVTAGDVSTSYNAGGTFYNSADDALLLQTQYGAEYVQMRNAVVVKIFSYGNV